jgi:triacylglycerol lipase
MTLMPAFEPNVTEYSLNNARLLGQAATVAYHTERDIQSWASANGFETKTVQFFSERGQGFVNLCDTQGFIAENDLILVVAFRGSEPKQLVDWLDDAQICQSPWGTSGAKVHNGFAKSLSAVWGTIGLLPERLQNRGNKTVWITGHSLGGALAELCAARVAMESGIPVQGVYTFGQPRVGDGSFATAVENAIGGRIFRHVNHRDLVPRVPGFGMFYRHYGAQIFFDKSGTAAQANPSVETIREAAALLLPLIHDGIIGDLFQGLFAHLKHPTEFTLTDVRDVTSVAAWERVLKHELETGTAPIADHSMELHYLKNLGTELKV